jgi:hypothetical protein
MFPISVQKFSRYFEVYIFAVFQNNYLFVPLYLPELLTMFGEAKRSADHWLRNTAVDDAAIESDDTQAAVVTNRYDTRNKETVAYQQ